ECIRLIGKEKVERAFEIQDSFKEEDEIESKLINLVGRDKVYCVEKLRMIKCFKDASKFGIR
ncbi:unnamed protein product, partial [Brachionus calyciflorus]